VEALVAAITQDDLVLVVAALAQLADKDVDVFGHARAERAGGRGGAARRRGADGRLEGVLGRLGGSSRLL
jgi:hypothetical protein